MTESPSTQIIPKRGFTSISRWLTGTIANPPPQTPINQDHLHQRHPHLIAREAIAIGILTTLFLLTAITNEFTAFTNAPAIYLLIPLLTVLALHLLCVIASQLALIAKPFQRTDRPGHADLTQGIIILTLFSIYAIFRILHPIADWFTPIAWIWLALLSVDLIGRIFEKIACKSPTA